MRPEAPDPPARPLTVVYVGNFDPPHSTENYVARALRWLGHVVVPLREQDPDTFGVAGDLARDGAADLLLWTRTGWEWDQLGTTREQVYADQLAMLDAYADAHVPSVGYHLDRWWGLPREYQVTEEPFFRVDLLCTADGGHDAEYAAAGVQHRWTPPAVSGEHAATPGARVMRWRSDVAFVGRWKHYHPEWAWRRELVEWLRRMYRNRVRIYSGEVPDDQLANLYVSAGVTVGDSCLVGGATRYWSNRIPETLGRGGLLIHPDVEGLDLHFTPGEHLATFPVGDTAALKDTIDWWLGHPKEGQAMRDAGRAWVLDRHTFEQRLFDLLAELTDSGRLPDPYRVANAVGVSRLWRDHRSAVFDLRPNSSDGVILGETWQDNVYRCPPEAVADGLVMDVGANVGAFALWAAAAGAAEVHAWEPHPDNRQQLRDNLARNPDLEARIHVHEEAVGGEVGVAYMAMGDPHWQAAAMLVAARTDWPVDVISLRDAITEAVACSEHNEVAFLKIDAEWAEYEMARTIGEALYLVRAAALEFHGPWNAEPAAGALDPLQVERFGRLCAELAERGSVEVLGRPSTGGYIYWRRYDR